MTCLPKRAKSLSASFLGSANKTRTALYPSLNRHYLGTEMFKKCESVDYMLLRPLLLHA